MILTEILTDSKEVIQRSNKIIKFRLLTIVFWILAYYLLSVENCSTSYIIGNNIGVVDYLKTVVIRIQFIVLLDLILNFLIVKNYRKSLTDISLKLSKFTDLTVLFLSLLWLTLVMDFIVY